eukprot:15363764-Alexandrium_andersonii.AAC.1
MSASLVGSEMCIRDSPLPLSLPRRRHQLEKVWPKFKQIRPSRLVTEGGPCLLYTSDAADDM